VSSEAAYFANALATTADVRQSDSRESQIPSELFESAPTSEDFPDPSSDATISISEIADEDLLRQVRSGSKDALALLFRRYARGIRNVAFRILRNEAEADDLVQEVFLFIFRKASLFDGSQGAARSWIFQVAYHRAFDRRRYLNSRHFYTSQELEETAGNLADARDELQFHEVSIEGILGKRLTATFNSRLTPEQRETIRLFFFEGYALKEIAQVTGRSLVNVRQHYYRGLARLRKFILPEKLRSK
jgi:RNA polymerase sigma-70 factor (ECF subfamily)